MTTPDFFWELFKATGSVSAYLAYKRLKNRVS